MAEKKKVKLQRIISPVGVSAYAWIDKPDTKFSGDKEGNYKITLRLKADDPLVAEYGKNIRALAAATAKEDGTALKKNCKLGKVLAEEGEEGHKPEFDGEVHIEFKSIYQPSCFDSAGNPIDPTMIRSGDVVRVSGFVKPYEAFGSGIAMKLHQVQLIEKRATGTSDSAFDAYEGGFVAEGSSTSSDQVDDDDDNTDGAGF